GGTETGTAGGSVGLSFAGFGSGSINTVSNTTEAALRNGATVSAGGQLRVSAEDDADVKADAGALSLGVSVGSYRGVGVAGQSFAVNTITDSTRATVDGATARAGGIAVEATSGGRIVAVAEGASGSLA